MLYSEEKKSQKLFSGDLEAYLPSPPEPSFYFKANMDLIWQIRVGYGISIHNNKKNVLCNTFKYQNLKELRKKQINSK